MTLFTFCRFARHGLTTLIFALIFLFFVFSQAHSGITETLFREDFANLDDWRPLYFSKITKHSTYTIENNSGESNLRAESNASASAILYRKDFHVYDYPMVRWRWKINNIYKNVDPETKSGDDYPIRIYIIFRYNPDKAGHLEGLQYNIAKRRYGEYPPHSTLSYVWASKEGQKDAITSPYTDRAKLIALEKGGNKAGTWQAEEVNILSDYRKVFGKDPPEVASLAIMNDSDNTGQSSVSYVDFIEVYRYGP
jgi:hypothetical protein